MGACLFELYALLQGWLDVLEYGGCKGVVPLPGAVPSRVQPFSKQIETVVTDLCALHRHTTVHYQGLVERRWEWSGHVRCGIKKSLTDRRSKFRTLCRLLSCLFR